KMFFIVNASDLAQNEADLNLVLQYVEDQLLQFGIRHPKIFPVSSKSSLEEKEQNLPLNEEMQTFEQSFYPFIEEDLTTLTIETAMWDVNLAKNKLKNFIHAANVDDTDQEKAIEQLQHKLNQIETVVYDEQTSTAEKRMKERIE